jgi:ectoine hydroxylase-related dioxygenase (phytanoyl-CoA dioxygenase family)
MGGDVKATREELLEKGYVQVENALDAGMLDELRRVTDGLLAQQSSEDAERYRYQGSNIAAAYQDPVFARLFAWPRALGALRELGFTSPKWWSTFLLSKPPHAPPLYWHQDWWAWDEPISASPVPAQVFLMYYLTDTNPHNGCLRVIPGTHYRHNPLHDLLPPAHTRETYDANPNSVIFSRRPDEVDVPVKAGDLLIGDARILHAAHANQTDQHRSLLTLWYFPDYATLPDSIKAYAARKEPLEAPKWWPEPEGSLMEPLIPRYEGNAAPAVWNRVPGNILQR